MSSYNGSVDVGLEEEKQVEGGGRPIDEEHEVHGHKVVDFRSLVLWYGDVLVSARHEKHYHKQTHGEPRREEATGRAKSGG